MWLVTTFIRLSHFHIAMLFGKVSLAPNYARPELRNVTCPNKNRNRPCYTDCKQGQISVTTLA
jgi:hypothetical protein